MSLTGAARLHGQQGGKGLEGQPQLGPEAAAQFHGHNPDVGQGHVQHPGKLGPHLVGPLGGRPDGQAAVGLHAGNAGHGFQETLVDALGAKGILENVVGLLEGRVHVAPVGVQQGTDVAAFDGKAVALVALQVGMHRRGAGPQGQQRVHHRLQVLVFDINQADGFLGGYLILGGHRRHRFADVIDRVPRHDVPVFQGAGAEADFGKSAPVMTARTPGRASALDVSMLTMRRGCGRWGEPCTSAYRAGKRRRRKWPGR